MKRKTIALPCDEPLVGWLRRLEEGAFIETLPASDTIPVILGPAVTHLERYLCSEARRHGDPAELTLAQFVARLHGGWICRRCLENQRAGRVRE